MRERVPNADKAVFSVHCHNDLGLAVANSLAGIEGGARQVECTINGIGERAGNAALEEIVMALRTRADVLPYETGVESTMLTRASKLRVSHATNFPVQFNKAIVGRNAFAHESGIHQDGMLKNAATYEIMTPGLGRPDQDLPGDGQAFGPGGLPLEAGRSRLHLSDNQFQDAFDRFKALGRPQEARLRRGYRGAGRREPRHGPRPDPAGVPVGRSPAPRGPQRATLRIADEAGTRIEEADGNGPVDAVFNAISALVPHQAQLELYQVHAVTGGTDAQAEVSVRLRDGERSVTGPRRRSGHPGGLREGVSLGA